MPLPGVLALVNIQTAPLSVRPYALQALVTVLVPVTAECLVTTPGKSVNTFVLSCISKQNSSDCLWLTSSLGRDKLSCSTCLRLQSRIFQHFSGTCPEGSRSLQWIVIDDVLLAMTQTPGEAGLRSTLVIPAPSQAVSVRGARALAMTAGALTGAPPLATIVLRRKTLLKHRT